MRVVRFAAAAAADKIDGLGTAVPEIHPRNPRRGQNWPQNAGKSKFEIQLMAWSSCVNAHMDDGSIFTMYVSFCL